MDSSVASSGFRQSFPRTHYARSGVYSIAYQVVGSGSVDLVFVPGFVSNVDLNWEHERFAAFYRHLASFSRLIVFDKRGTGLSDRVPPERMPTLEERMDDIRAVMDAAGSDRASLFGISEGGPLALLFAATYPERVRSIVLANSYARRFRDDIALLSARVREHWGTGASLAALAPSWRSSHDRRFLARYERASATPDAAAKLVMLTDEIDVRPVLPSIAAPTRVLHRRDDDMIPVRSGEEVAAGIPGAEFVLFDGRDHLIFVDGETVLRSAETFLTGVATRPVPTRMLTTVVFVDIVESTRLAEQLGDEAWTKVLGRFHDDASEELVRYRGSRVSTAGDGLLATFDGPARAVRFGTALQRRVAARGVSLRVGVHTAEVERVGDDVAGVGVHVGARVAAVATPGEVWVTRTVRDLVAGSGLRFTDRGSHRLKGLSEPWSLLAVAS